MPIDKFKHRIVNHRTIKYQSWLTYLQLAMTILGVIIIAYKTISVCISFGFPLVRRLIPNFMRRKKDRVRQYCIVRQPRQNIELRQKIRPSVPSLSSNL